MVPAIYYHEKMQSTEFVKADYSSVVINGRDGNTVKATVADGRVYDIGTGSQTIQIKIKGSGPFNWPHFMGKTTRFTQVGWTMFTNSGGSWCFSIRGSNTSEKRLQVTTPNLFDNSWHTVTAVIYDSAGSKWVKRFMDGVRIQDDNGTRNLGANPGSISSSDPLMIGWGDDTGFGAMTFNVADFEIFNTALTDEEVRNNLCLKDLSKHPKYTNLIGYWPCYDGFGSRFKNLAPGMSTHSLGLTGPYLWNADPVIPCTITPTPAGSNKAQVMLSSAGVPGTIFYWLRISVNSKWGIEPSNWLSLYETEFIGVE
ncbi:LamG-like jellyroll fold domain-containing protein [Niabella yanshanensis]